MNRRLILYAALTLMLGCNGGTVSDQEEGYHTSEIQFLFACRKYSDLNLEYLGDGSFSVLTVVDGSVARSAAKDTSAIRAYVEKGKAQKRLLVVTLMKSSLKDNMAEEIDQIRALARELGFSSIVFLQDRSDRPYLYGEPEDSSISRQPSAAHDD